MKAARDAGDLDLREVSEEFLIGFRTGFRALDELGLPVPAGGRVLDLGCGAGEGVRALLTLGYDGYGCDMKFKSGPHVDQLHRAGRIVKFPFTPYRLPFPDGWFDAIVTSSVMEHVPNYEETVREMRRVLKLGGATLHTFPAKWRPIEPHVHVPLAGVFQSTAWLRFWATLGFRAPEQVGKPPAEVAAENRLYLTSGTNYLTGRQLHAEFAKAFDRVIFAEKAMLKVAAGKGRLVYAAGRIFPPLFRLYRWGFKRVVVSA